MMTAHEFVEALRNKTLRIKPDAQRSIVSASQKVSTEHLLDTDKVEKSPRMQSFIKFCKRVMNEVEKGKTMAFLVHPNSPCRPSSRVLASNI